MVRSVRLCIMAVLRAIMFRLQVDIIVHVFEQNEEHFPQEVIDYDDEVNLYWQKENVVLLER